MNLAGIEEPFVVVLVGAAGSGKSTWAARRFRRTEIVSSDDLRAVVGTGDADLDTTADAFAALDLIVAARVKRRLTTVIDTLGLDPVRRRGYLELARAGGMPALVVLLETDAALCRARNRARDRPVPAPALTAQLRPPWRRTRPACGCSFRSRGSPGTTIRPPGSDRSRPPRTRPASRGSR
jgi:predicted kinase